MNNKSIVTYIAAGGVVAVVVTALIGMIVMAVRLDGEIATQVFSAFQNIVLVLVPCLTGIIGIDTYKSITIARAASTTGDQAPTLDQGAAPASMPGGNYSASTSAIIGPGVD
jgi:hypothetical protein